MTSPAAVSDRTPFTPEVLLRKKVRFILRTSASIPIEASLMCLWERLNLNPAEVRCILTDEASKHGWNVAIRPSQPINVPGMDVVVFTPQ